MEAAGARGRHGDAAVRRQRAYAVVMETPCRTAARGRQTTRRALGDDAAPARGRGSGRKDSPSPQPAPCSTRRSVTPTEVERSRQWGQGRRGPERLAAGGKGPRGAADRAHEKACFPGGAPGAPCSLPPRLQQADVLPPGVTRWRPRPQTSARHPAPRGTREPPHPTPPGTVPKIRLEWLRTPRPVTRREMKPMRVCLGAGPPSLRSARLVPVPVRRRATRGDAIKGADLCSRGAAGRGLRKLPRPCLTLQPQVCGAGSQEGKVEPERGPASPSWNSRGGT